MAKKYFKDLKLSFGYHTAGNFPFTHCVKELDGVDGVFKHNDDGTISSRKVYDLEAWNEFKDLKVGARILGCVDSELNELAQFSGNAYTCVYHTGDQCFCVYHKPDEYVKVIEEPQFGKIQHTTANSKIIDLGQLCNISRVGVISLGGVAADETIELKNKAGTANIGHGDADRMSFANASDNFPGIFKEKALSYLSDKLHVNVTAEVAGNNVYKAIVYIVYKPQDIVEVTSLNPHANATGGYIASEEFIDAKASEVYHDYAAGNALSGGNRYTIIRMGVAGNVVDATVVTAAWEIQAGNAIFGGAPLVLQQTTGDGNDVALKVTARVRFIKS